MALNLKYFTPEQADALIPELTEIFTNAIDLKKQIDARSEEWSLKRETISPVDQAVIQGQVEFLVSQLDLQLARVEALGSLPKDLNEGLVDFPSRLDGREVYLCWRLGESKVENWHGIADGARGRQPL